MAGHASILIVDDSEAMRKMLRAMLETIGHRCAEASNGIEAVERLGQRATDLVITDLDMPISSGIELIKYMGGQQRFSSIPVVVCTARDDDPKLTAELAGIGNHQRLHKPVSASELIQRVQGALGV